MSGAARVRAAAAARAHAGGRRAPSGSALRPAASPVPDHRASPVPDPHLRGGRLGADLQQLLRAPGARCSAPQACGQRIGVDKGVGQLLGGSARHRGWGWEHRPGRGGSRALPPPAGRRPGRRAPGSSAEARSHRQASDGPAWSISAPVAGGRFRGLERLRKGPGGRGGGQGTQGGRPGKRTTRGGGRSGGQGAMRRSSGPHPRHPPRMHARRNAAALGRLPRWPHKGAARRRQVAQQHACYPSGKPRRAADPPERVAADRSACVRGSRSRLA